MRFLFYIAKHYSIPIILPLIDYLEKTEENEFLLFVSEKVRKKLVEEYVELNKKTITSVQDGINFNPDFCLSPGNYIDFRLPGIKVELFHGIGIEKESHYQIRHFFDVYLTSGPVVTERFERMRKKYRYFLVRETGWAKMDYILNYPVKDLKRKLGLAKDKKIVLYAPTFSQKMQSSTNLLPAISQFAKQDELWLVKFHELMKKEHIELLQKTKTENVRLIATSDITPYLHCADVMISDTSSVLYEFMALDKPVITFNTIKRKDKGIDITSLEELRPALDRVFQNPAEHKAQRKTHLAEVNPYLDGTIAERIFSILCKIKENDELPKKKKPLNLYRKLRILYHEKYKKGYLK